MKKRFFAVAMATTLALSSVMTASAETISGGWWTSFTSSYKLEDTTKLSIDVKGGDSNWNNISAAFTNVAGAHSVTDNADYKEYGVVRADSWGWGGGENMCSDGTAYTYTSTLTDLDGDGDIWTDFRACMKDAHIDATFTKSGSSIEMKYAVEGANGTKFDYTVNFTDSDITGDVYVFFICDTSEITVSKVEEPTTEEPTTEGATTATEKVTTSPEATTATELVTTAPDATTEVVTTAPDATTATTKVTTGSSSSDATAAVGKTTTVTVAGKDVAVGVTDASNVLPKDAVLAVKPLDKSSESYTKAVGTIKDLQKVNVVAAEVLQLNLTSGDKALTQLDGKVAVTVDVPASLDTSKEIVAYRMNDDGTTTALETTVKDGKITFTTDHFSTFALVQTDKSVATETTAAATTKAAETTTSASNVKTGDSTPIAVLFAVAIGACGAVVLSRKKITE